MDHKVTPWNSVGKYFSYHILKLNTISIPGNIQYPITPCPCYSHTLWHLIERATCPLCDFSLYTLNSKGSQLPSWLVWFLLLFGLCAVFFLFPQTHTHTQHWTMERISNIKCRNAAGLLNHNKVKWWRW